MQPSDEAFKRYIKVITVEEMISPQTHSQKLEAVNPPPCPELVREFFDFLQEHVTLQSTGMGVSLRESRVALAQLMEKRGWEYELYSTFVDAYEGALLKAHYDAIEDKK